MKGRRRQRINNIELRKFANFLGSIVLRWIFLEKDVKDGNGLIKLRMPEYLHQC